MKPRPGHAEQQAPRRGDKDILPLVMQDLDDRAVKGIEQYGVPLRTKNGRDALIDLYQELLDAVCYLRQHLEERDVR